MALGFRMGLSGGGGHVKRPIDIVKDGIIQSGFSIMPVTNTRSGWASFSTVAPSVIQGNNVLTVSCPAATNATRTGTAYIEIDLTNYSTLTVEFSSITVGTGSGTSTDGAVCLVQTMAQSYTVSMALGGANATIGATTMQANVSNLSGTYCLAFNYICNANRSISYNIKNIKAA